MRKEHSIGLARIEWQETGLTIISVKKKRKKTEKAIARTFTDQ